ncbi:ABC transporter ATP-binding protein/permease [Oscillospiraceae bacterium CLA-AA-H250]|uniref:ABC transporter ATP-binding protein/permease n=2 Tax=Hominenteromicrobium TaxID=3073575 RepID=A0AAE3ALW1_9FIRM|nr:ABC transporter ATP-binding protein [Hominenteromicrobium mulieris]MCC2137907.1 ABC transporter ATP-binding protein/permease [Hominenteromicrobium mulieris]
MKTNRKSAEFQPNRVLSYFKAEWRALLIVTVSGLIYNIGLLTEPWFEGTMTGYLVEILKGTGQFSGMLMLVISFAVVTAVVQVSRYVKRFYVRRFANNVNRRMKETLYGSLVKKSRASLREEGEGNIMTKAILDVDDCVEGMRKFTTEIFDTGVALTAYLCMLLWYDWRLTILCMLFPPISYVTAEKMKKVIQKAGAAYKEQSGRLSTATLDRAENAMTYRVFGLEKKRQAVYEENLTSYEKAAVKANIWNAAMPPIYRIISMAGVFFILYFGQKNVLGTGWQAWSIASFTTFLVCFVKLSVKSSSAAKLFNAVHKAQVSWNRIKPLLPQEEENKTDEVKVKKTPVEALKVKHLSFTYPDGKKILDDISFSAKKGQIIGITGAVACGKSTLGKAFLCEYPYEGHITVDGAELQNMEQSVRTGIVGYLGHDPELFNDSVENNVLLGDSKNSDTYLNAACIKQEVAEMTDGKNTLIGSGGTYLSGGQAKRLAFARTLCHDKPILILDDPFSALDKNTEKQAFVNLQALAKDSIVLLISHRLYLFPEMDGVIWMENGKAVTGTHEELLKIVPEYKSLYTSQVHTAENGGAEHDAQKTSENGDL